MVTLILKSMLKINAKLFPNYIRKTGQEETESNFGILFIILGVILYLLDIFIGVRMDLDKLTKI